MLATLRLCASLLLAACSVTDAADKPNVILILADDLGYGELGCYGHAKFKTPLLDRMAAEGARLTQFNTPMPFCAPTRASLLTGDAASPHSAVFGQQAARLASVRDDRWKLHVLPPRDNFRSLNKPGERWIDPRGPDGVTILAPYEQYQPSEHPGLHSGDEPKLMQLFDLKADPGEQKDVAAQHPEIVKRMKTLYDGTNQDVPSTKSK